MSSSPLKGVAETHRAGIRFGVSLVVPESRSYESVNDPRSDRRERVAPRTRFFLSNSLVPQTSPRRSSTFRFFSLRPSSSFSIVPLFPSSLRRSCSYCNRRRRRRRSVVASFLFPAKPPRSRSEKPDRIFISDLVHNERDPHPSHRDRRSPIPIVKSARSLVFASARLVTLALRGKMSIGFSAGEI